MKTSFGGIPMSNEIFGTFSPADSIDGMRRGDEDVLFYEYNGGILASVFLLIWCDTPHGEYRHLAKVREFFPDLNTAITAFKKHGFTF